MHIKVDNKYIQSCIYRLRYSGAQRLLASDVVIGSYTEDLTLAAHWSNVEEAKQVAAAIKGDVI